MKYSIATDLMVKLIKSEITGEELQNFNISHPIQEEILHNLFLISKKNDLFHIVANSLLKNGFISDSSAKQYCKQCILKAITKYEKQKYEIERISNTLEKHGIDFILLKGSVIRNFYPEPWMRTSCDIDILIREKNLDKAKKVIMQDLHYSCGEKGAHDIAMFSESGICLELHYRLMDYERNSKIADITLQVWDYSYRNEGTNHSFSINGKMFYFYHIAHMAKHFIDGGCGVKPFIDLWIIKNKMNFNKNECKDLLYKAGLLTFADNAEQLLDVWFGNRERNQVIEIMEEYIIKGGVFGNLQNYILTHGVENGSKSKYLFNKIFLPYDFIKYQYPVLQEKKYLTPIYEVKRWFKLIFKGGIKRSVDEIQINSKISEDSRSKMLFLLKNLGLK